MSYPFMLPLALDENNHRLQPELARPLLKRLHTASEWSHSTLTLRITTRPCAYGSFGSSSNSPLAPRRLFSFAHTAPFTKSEDGRELSTRYTRIVPSAWPIATALMESTHTAVRVRASCEE